MKRQLINNSELKPNSSNILKVYERAEPASYGRGLNRRCEKSQTSFRPIGRMLVAGFGMMDLG